LLFALISTTLLPLLFFFTVTATTEIYTLSLHDALPIYTGVPQSRHGRVNPEMRVDGAAKLFAQRVQGRAVFDPLGPEPDVKPLEDRKSTRLNSSHLVISYAVFCLKKKRKQMSDTQFVAS